MCVCVCVCVCKIQPIYKKKEIVLFMTTWMDLDGIMLNEMSNRVEWWLMAAEVWGKWRDADQSV